MVVCVHSHVDSTWPAVHSSITKTSSAHRCVWTKASLYNSVHSLFQFQWACLSKFIFQLTNKITFLACSAKLESVLLFEEAGSPDFRVRKGSGRHARCICGTHCLDFSNTLVPNVLENQWFLTSQNNVELGNKNTLESNWPDDHCTSVPCQRTWSSRCLLFPLKLVLTLRSEGYLHIRSHGFPWLPWFSGITVSP